MFTFKTALKKIQCVFYSSIWNFLCSTAADSQFRYFQSFPKRKWIFSLHTMKGKTINGIYWTFHPSLLHLSSTPSYFIFLGRWVVLMLLMARYKMFTKSCWNCLNYESILFTIVKSIQTVYSLITIIGHDHF